MGNSRLKPVISTRPGRINPYRIYCCSRDGRAGGSVLILTLWVLFFLAALAVAVSSYVKANIGLASEMKNRTTAYYSAKAGVEYAVGIALGDTNGWDGATEIWFSSEDMFRDIEVGRGSFSLEYSVEQEGSVVTNYGLIDEERKININTADKLLLEVLVQICGEVDSGTALEVAEGIIDWRDEDDDVLTNGAENSYYSALGTPYECRNGHFLELSELLLVKGVTPEMFAALDQYVTVYGDGKVNINTADKLVLQCAAMAGGAEEDVAASMAAKIAGFTGQGGVFDEPSEGAMLKAIAGHVDLSGKEKKAFSRSLGRITIKSRVLRGNVYGKAFGRNDVGSKIEFVVDRNDGVRLLWRES